MKKFYTVFLAASVAFFALAACGNPNEPGQDQPDLPGNDTTETPGGNDTIVTPPTMDQLIQGTWLLDSIIVDTGTDIYHPDVNTNRYTRYNDGTFTTGGPLLTSLKSSPRVTILLRMVSSSCNISMRPTR